MQLMQLTLPNIVLSLTAAYSAGMATKNAVKVVGMEQPLANLAKKLTGSSYFENKKLGYSSCRGPHCQEQQGVAFQAESGLTKKIFGDKTYHIKQERIDQFASVGKIALYSIAAFGYYSAIQ